MGKLQGCVHSSMSMRLRLFSTVNSIVLIADCNESVKSCLPTESIQSGRCVNNYCYRNNAENSTFPSPASKSTRLFTAIMPFIISNHHMKLAKLVILSSVRSLKEVTACINLDIISDQLQLLMILLLYNSSISQKLILSNLQPTKLLKLIL